MSTKVVPPAVKRKPPAAGKGRPKGSQNKVSADVKAMVLEALHHAGGAEYLYLQAFDNPKAFVALVSRVLPMTIDGRVTVSTIAERIKRAEERTK